MVIVILFASLAGAEVIAQEHKHEEHKEESKGTLTEKAGWPAKGNLVATALYRQV
jgi:hypothetical protein